MTDNDEEEEGGWAGAQDEVDYAAKLDFEDFEDDDKPSLEQPVKPEIETPSGEPETRWQGNESRPVSKVICHVVGEKFSSILGQKNNFDAGLANV